MLGLLLLGDEIDPEDPADASIGDLFSSSSLVWALGASLAQTIFNAGAVLTWNAVPDSTGYWLEIGQDSVFQQVVDSRWGLQRNGMETAGLAIGSYYWRVAALDKFVDEQVGITRPEAVRLILRDWLIGNRMLDNA